MGSIASQDDGLRAFLADDTLMASTGSSIPYLENAAGQRLLYHARLDALDGALRSFRVIASGDRLGEAYDEVTGTSAFIVYESAQDFRRQTPDLAASLGNAVSDVDFGRETLVGPFVEPLEYLGPTIRGDFVVERGNGTEVSTEGERTTTSPGSHGLEIGGKVLFRHASSHLEHASHPIHARSRCVPGGADFAASRPVGVSRVPGATHVDRPAVRRVHRWTACQCGLHKCSFHRAAPAP